MQCWKAWSHCWSPIASLHSRDWRWIEESPYPICQLLHNPPSPTYESPNPLEWSNHAHPFHLSKVIQKCLLSKQSPSILINMKIIRVTTWGIINHRNHLENNPLVTLQQPCVNDWMSPQLLLIEIPLGSKLRRINPYLNIIVKSWLYWLWLMSLLRREGDLRWNDGSGVENSWARIILNLTKSLDLRGWKTQIISKSKSFGSNTDKY